MNGWGQATIQPIRRIDIAEPAVAIHYISDHYDSQPVFSLIERESFRTTFRSLHWFSLNIDWGHFTGWDMNRRGHWQPPLAMLTADYQLATFSRIHWLLILIIDADWYYYAISYWLIIATYWYRIATIAIDGHWYYYLRHYCWCHWWLLISHDYDWLIIDISCFHAFH